MQCRIVSWMSFLVVAGVVAMMIPGRAQAQGMSAHDNMPGMSAPSQDSPSSAGYKSANDKMMRDMSAPLTGDADRDFVRGMIPHHQGAIDMAEVELRYGKDRRLKKLARDIVAAQKKEIAFMRKWEAAHPH